MALSDIAAGIETTTRQRDRGVAAVDATDRSLADALGSYADELPCSPGDAATVLERYVGGGTVGEAARAAGLPPVTASKVLHRCGVDGVSPLSPIGRRVVRDWLAAELSRADALALTDVSEPEFALATYVETHDPVPGARAAVERVFGLDGDAMVQKRDELAETMTDARDLF